MLIAFHRSWFTERYSSAYKGCPFIRASMRISECLDEKNSSQWAFVHTQIRTYRKMQIFMRSRASLGSRPRIYVATWPLGRSDLDLFSAASWTIMSHNLVVLLCVDTLQIQVIDIQELTTKSGRGGRGGGSHFGSPLKSCYFEL